MNSKFLKQKENFKQKLNIYEKKYYAAKGKLYVFNSNNI